MVGPGTVQLTWLPPKTNGVPVVSYRIYGAVSGRCGDVVCVVKDTRSTTTTKLVQGDPCTAVRHATRPTMFVCRATHPMTLLTGLECGEEYSFEVAALCEAGEGPRSLGSLEVEIPKPAPQPRVRARSSAGEGPVRLCGKLSTAMRQGISAGIRAKGEIALGERAWVRDMLRGWRDQSGAHGQLLPHGATLMVEDKRPPLTASRPKAELMPMLAKKKHLVARK